MVRVTGIIIGFLNRSFLCMDYCEPVKNVCRPNAQGIFLGAVPKTNYHIIITLVWWSLHQLGTLEVWGSNLRGDRYQSSTSLFKRQVTRSRVTKKNSVYREEILRKIKGRSPLEV
jgi:hypothetical protein